MQDVLAAGRNEGGHYCQAQLQLQLQLDWASLITTSLPPTTSQPATHPE